LRARGVAHAAVFGSVARGEQRPGSDIDIMIDVEPSVSRLFRSVTPAHGCPEGAAPSLEWKQMAAAGNVYRHDYEDVAA
jgi:hypothetical protein